MLNNFPFLLEMTSSNECTTDDPPNGDQSNCFMPSDPVAALATSSNLEGLVFDPPQNGKFFKHVSHQNFNDCLLITPFNFIKHFIFAEHERQTSKF